MPHSESANHAALGGTGVLEENCESMGTLGGGWGTSLPTPALGGAGGVRGDGGAGCRTRRVRTTPRWVVAGALEENCESMGTPGGGWGTSLPTPVLGGAGEDCAGVCGVVGWVL
ncbi:hypothetical protein HNQ65_001039 [Prosthecobacter vanneervenii]|uniref:Uncharacterized protein n=1 Tax=Prosthecobacter vanneervenii TaxID=48466 RepID=A0A7W7Y911_9BACT|nr:hypothetical protein [Prosthecobacter vanneervenii]